MAAFIFFYWNLDKLFLALTAIVTLQIGLGLCIRAPETCE